MLKSYGACILGLATLAVLLGIVGDIVPDFAQDYAAAWAVLHGREANTPTVQLLEDCCPSLDMREYARRFEEEAALLTMQTAHPPAATLAALPFALLPWEAARWLWIALGVAAVSLTWVALRVPPLLCAATIFMWGLAFLQGTFEPFLFGLLAAWLLNEERRPWLAGAMLGAAVAIKLYPLVLVGGVVLARRWRVLAATAASALALVALGELLIGGTAGWVAFMPINTQRWVDAAYNTSLVRLARSQFPALSPTLAAAGVLAFLAAPLVPLLRRGNSKLLVPVMLLGSPLAWVSYLGMIALTDVSRRIAWVLVGVGMVYLAVLLKLVPDIGLAVLVYVPLTVCMLMIWYAPLRTPPPAPASAQP